jgi:hypothetical protein
MGNSEPQEESLIRRALTDSAVSIILVLASLAIHQLSEMLGSASLPWPVQISLISLEISFALLTAGVLVKTAVAVIRIIKNAGNELGLSAIIRKVWTRGGWRVILRRTLLSLGLGVFGGVIVFWSIIIAATRANSSLLVWTLVAVFLLSRLTLTSKTITMGFRYASISEGSGIVTLGGLTLALIILLPTVAATVLRHFFEPNVVDSIIRLFK